MSLWCSFAPGVYHSPQFSAAYLHVERSVRTTGFISAPLEFSWASLPAEPLVAYQVPDAVHHLQPLRHRLRPAGIQRCLFIQTSWLYTLLHNTVFPYRVFFTKQHIATSATHFLNVFIWGDPLRRVSALSHLLPPRPDRDKLLYGAMAFCRSVPQPVTQFYLTSLYNFLAIFSILQLSIGPRKVSLPTSGISYEENLGK